MRPVLFSSLVCAGSALIGACHYDIDKIYKHQPAQTPDQVPADLIDFWADDRLPSGCKQCAREACGDVNESCRGDEECVAFTKCVAAATNPAEQNNCRAQHTDWLREDIRLRDVGGPYHTCVFLNECATPCESQKDFSCSAGYDWPKSSAPTVALHLLLLEGLESNPAVGVRVRACTPDNAATCTAVSDWATSDASGVVDLDVRTVLGVFTGYLELEGGGLYPTLMRFGWPIARDMTTKVAVVSDINAKFLVNSVIPPVATPSEVTKQRGFFQVRAFACNGISAVDVAFSSDMADQYTQSWYTKGTEIFPSFSLEGTTELGAGGIINVVPGRRIVTASHDGEVVASFSAPVRAGYMTIVLEYPGVMP